MIFLIFHNLTFIVTKFVVYLIQKEVNNMQDYKLTINMFGEFSIVNEAHSLITSKAKSPQMNMLLSYLIANKETDVTKDKLIDVLWPEENSNNPSGALRNLVYRARNEMSEFFPGSQVESILLVGNTYHWNPEIECDVDIYKFEQYCNLASREENPDKRYFFNTQAHLLYKGEFLPMFRMESWVMFRSNYYGNLYTKCILSICDYLNAHEKYRDILLFCEEAINVHPLEESIHKEKINAYLKLGEVQNAMDYYYSIVDLFNQKYGLDITSTMQDIYQSILSQMPNQHVDMDELVENLKNDKNSDGSFYCNFDIFKNIYQINLRSVRRSQSKRYLLLMTLSDLNADSELTVDIRQEMDILHGLMSRCLRRNDVYTQSSFCQFSLIITVANEAGCNTVVKRLRERYIARRQHSNVKLTIDIELIM